MAFAASGLNCVAVGPTKLYIYYTTDTLTSTANFFNTTSCPGMAAGDIIMLAHNTSANLSLVRISAIDATSCTLANAGALA
jgi:hypothetical protein